MEDTINIKTYSLKNGIYYVIGETDYNNHHYVYLSNENDDTDLMLRRINGDMLEPLNSEEEVMEVLKLITK